MKRGLFKCRICNHECNGQYARKHLKNAHRMDAHQYVLWQFPHQDGKCQQCGTDRPFLGLHRGYATMCVQCAGINKAIKWEKSGVLTTVEQAETIKEIVLTLHRTRTYNEISTLCGFTHTALQSWAKGKVRPKMEAYEVMKKLAAQEGIA